MNTVRHFRLFVQDTLAKGRSTMGILLDDALPAMKSHPYRVLPL